jgi:hypothetical protein
VIDEERERESTSELGGSGCRQRFAHHFSFLIFSSTSADLFFVAGKALFSLHCILRRVYHREVVGSRRFGLTRLGDIGAIGVRVLLGEAYGIEECKRKDRTAKGKGKEMTR